MALTSKLCNPTPWKVEFPYDQGIEIVVEPFNSVNLTMTQLDDFRDGKPGSEAVHEILDYFGLFLYDSDRPYDNQALEALNRTVQKKQAQYNSTLKSVQDKRAAQGIPQDDESLEAVLNTMGYTKIRQQIDVLKEAISHYKNVVNEDDNLNEVESFDPTRTIFVMDPPTEFPSVAAMELFLKQPGNEQLASAHQSFVDAQNE